MELVSIVHEGSARWGVGDGDALRLAPRQVPSDSDLWGHIDGAPIGDTSAWERVERSAVTWRAPIPVPRRNIMCLGLNYADHAAEAQGVAPERAELPTDPIVFTKATTSVTGPAADVALDERVTRRLDWEVELGVVLGRGGRFIDADAAYDSILGYTVINDLSARDRQKRHQQFFLSKSMDASCPMGPGIVTGDAIADPHALGIRCWVNGVLKQDSNTRRMIFSIPYLISELSSVMTLQAGDIVATGTPSGVGFARSPREFLAPGDRVECEIDGIGRLTNRITD
jgi:2-keto-4-pentenoate hydratase/2-oxohepta-3-ene-1,7-dioic acid hydratase in catechol pathway